jgi:hypothetical protein
MTLSNYIDHDTALSAARDEEIRRGRELLCAAQRRYDGDMDEDDFAGYVCRYGAAHTARVMLTREITHSNPRLN